MQLKNHSIQMRYLCFTENFPPIYYVHRFTPTVKLQRLCIGEGMRMRFASTCGALIFLATATAWAGDDTSPHTLFNPTPTDKMRDFNTDRPTKSNVPYTVPAGHFQYEGDIFIYGYDNTSTPDTPDHVVDDRQPDLQTRPAGQRRFRGKSSGWQDGWC